MVDSALSRPGQRERYDSKITQINWVFVICLIALASIGMLLQYSAGGMSCARLCDPANITPISSRTTPPAAACAR